MDNDDAPEGSRDADVVDETPDASDPKSVKRQRQKAKLKDDQRADFWKRTLADPVGRLVIWELLQGCGMFETKFAASPTGFPDMAATWFYLGGKNIGERLYRTLLRIDHGSVYQMHLTHDDDFAVLNPKRTTKTED